MLTVILLSQHRISSSETVRPRFTCGARCMRPDIRARFAVCLMAPHSQFSEGADLICAWTIKSPKASTQAIKLTQAVLQAYSNRSGTGSGNENMEREFILAVLCVPFIICPLKSADAKCGKVV